MKSAYELAMERLEREGGPGKKLSSEQRARIAEIDKIYDAKIAEARLQGDAEISAATTFEALEQARTAVAERVRSLEEQREKEKEAIWNER